MKKKIKDLTLEEMSEICSKHYCENCPLSVVGTHGGCYEQAYFLVNYADKFRESEVETDE